jgi:hypothetical protein
MLYDKQQLPELRFMKTFHDTETPNYYYEKNLLEKSLSPYIYENRVMSFFLNKLQGLLSLQFDSINVIKNWKNYMVDKYHYKQNG